MRYVWLTCLCLAGIMMSGPALVASAATKAAPTKTAPTKAEPAKKAATPATAETLKADIDRILADAGVPKTSMGVRVILLPEAAGRISGEVLYDSGGTTPLVPASTEKLVITGACFDRYGPDWRFTTYVGRIPSAVKGCKWDLAIIGGGDPNISGRFFDGDALGPFRKWIGVLKSRDVTAVGRIVLDDSLFDDVLQHPHWPTDQLDEWYEAPVSALLLNDGCIDVHVAAGKVGEPARITLDPPCSTVVIDGTILTVADKAKAAFSVDRVPEAAAGAAMKLKVGGRFWSGAPEAVEYRTVVNPTMFFGAVLADTLRAEGITVAGPVAVEHLCDKSGKARDDFTCDVKHASRLDMAVSVANKRSQSVYAECMMKLLGAYGADGNIKTELPVRQGTWANGAAEALKWMKDRGIPTDGCVIDDGSGNSKQDRLTALTVTELLAVMYARHGDVFVETLPVAGEDGSLASRMKNTAAHGRVYGKTGYVLGTSALSGYVRTKSGRTVAFSLIMNDVPWGELWKARQAQDRLCVRLVDY
jgi:serine-type D-Ala-D-Ala carboxypeptidase/endopeptidase (penicillin-binding protein 4)